MSKVDAQRAMKAARHAGTPAPATPAPARSAAARPAPASPAPARPAAATGGTGTTGTAAVTGSAAVTTDGAATPVEPGTGGPAAAEQLCGHRNMAGRECRRPAGHAEKSHRYS